NSGTNIADDVTYSGTVAGAIEGTLLGVPSIALSQAYPHGERARIPWETAEAHAPEIIRRLIAFGFPEAVLYNINFP
ncbi:MAG TPA: 5'/3'-nucleotidase SurE, partial [Bauldia sp.]|nr:5'/3'-nucleotidase SurE [Bauldia sp.]